MKSILWIIGIVLVIWYFLSKYTQAGASGECTNCGASSGVGGGTGISTGLIGSGAASPSVTTTQSTVFTRPPTVANPKTVTLPYTPYAVNSRTDPNTFQIAQPATRTPYYNPPAIATVSPVIGGSTFYGRGSSGPRIA